MEETSSHLGLLVGGIALAFVVVGVFLIAFPQIADSIVTYLKSQLPV
ncbi:MAG TPA: hypothetical protein VGC17_02285 [Lactovum miscens]